MSHTKPYKLHWVHEGGNVVVIQQVRVKFFIGQYEDNDLCDLISMEVFHFLLG